MSQAGYTPLQLYSSSTASAVPSAANLKNDAQGSELAINITDGKLYYKDNAGVVQLLASKAAATQTTISFGSMGFTPSTATGGAVTVSGTLIPANGGTGFSSYTVGDLIYASGVSTLAKLAVGTNGQVLTLVGGVPAWAASTGGVTSFSAGTTGFTPNTSTTGAITLAGTLNQVNGGTGFSTYTTGDLLYASASNTLSKLAAGTNGYVLTMAGGVPTWAAGGGGGGVTSISFGTTGLTPSTSTTGAVTVAGTLATSNGGTGLTSFTSGGAVYATSTSALTTGTLPATAGGTGLATYATGDIIYASAANTLSKLTAGTNGYVLTLAAGVPTWAAAAGGLTGFTAALNTSGTNSSVNVSSLTASGGTTSQGLALIPKGSGGFISGAIPDGTATGGDTRGGYSVDLQLSRSATNQVVSGSYSFMGAGYANINGGNYAGIVGGLSIASYGNYNGAIGGQSNTLNADYLVSLGGLAGSLTGSVSTLLNGYYVTDRGVRGSIVAGTMYAFGGVTNGVLQTHRVLLATQTTSAAGSIATSDGAVASSNNQLILGNNTAVYIKGRVIAGVTGGGNTKAWTFEGALKRGANAAATSIVGTIATNVIAADAGASTWTIAITADTTNGGVTVTVTGQAATTIRWAAEIQATEIGY